MTDNTIRGTTDEHLNDRRYHEHQGKFVCAPATAAHPEPRPSR